MDIDKIFNDFLLSALDKDNVELIKKIRHLWINYKSTPILNDEQPKSEQDKLKTGTLTMDEYFANCVKRQEKYNQHQSGEFITKEECEQRERKAFDAAREREGIPMNPNGAPPFLKYNAFSNYKQSLKQ